MVVEVKAWTERFANLPQPTVPSGGCVRLWRVVWTTRTWFFGLQTSDVLNEAVALHLNSARLTWPTWILRARLDEKDVTCCIFGGKISVNNAKL